MRAIARFLHAGLWLQVVLGGATALAQTQPGIPTQLLDVPFLPQSTLLCGGAAVAMVERWWGARGVYAEDFAALVRKDEGGIRTTDLEDATRKRGWSPQTFSGTAELIQQSLQDHVPVIALIQVGSDRYHFVVIIGWEKTGVVFHDPAGAPFTTVAVEDFETKWRGAEHWAMRFGPRKLARALTAIDSVRTTIDSLPCRPWLDRAVDSAAIDLAAGVRMIDAARHQCPDEPVILRELAGIRFSQGEHAEASRLADAYLQKRPEDPLGWQLIATAQFLLHDYARALNAWNHLGQPTVDLVRIDGQLRSHFSTLADAIAIPNGSILTANDLRLAQRRLAELPTLRRTSVDFAPIPGGMVEVRAAVSERPIVDPWQRLVLVSSIRALAGSEIGLLLNSPARMGETWSASWRWDKARPRAAFRLELPVRFGLPGVLQIDGLRERYRIDRSGVAADRLEENRRSVLLGARGWLNTAVRESAGLRYDHWKEYGRYLAVTTTTEYRALAERVILRATGEFSAALSGQASFSRGGVRAEAVSSRSISRPSLSLRWGIEAASDHSPAGFRPIAGGNVNWAVPLRAHRASDDGLLDGSRVGRNISHAGLAADHPVKPIGPVMLTAGVFLDAARVSGAFSGPAGSRNFLDGGAGLRIALLDGQPGAIRVDVAHTLLGAARWGVTVGVQR